MATDRRRAVATATSGAALTTAGGVLRHKGTQAANNGKVPAWELRRPLSTHQTRALLRTGARGRKRYLMGATLGLVGAPALAVGIHDSLARKEPAAKRDRRSFVQEGLAGTQDALEQRAEGIKEVPPQHRVGPLAVSAGAGFGGSLAAHRGLDRVKAFQGTRHGARAGLTALAGTTAAALSYPLARHTVRSKDYEVTPTGVRRRKERPVRPSSKATRAQPRSQSFTADMSKVHNPHSLTPMTSRGTPRKVHWRHGADDHAVCGLDGAFGRGTGPFAEHYGEVTCIGCARVMRIRKVDGNYSGRRTSSRTQRAAILAAGSTPVVGGIAGARTAGHFAPPGQRGHTERRQYGYTAAGSAAGGLAGAYGTAALASRHAGVAHATECAAAAHGRAKEKVLNLKPVNATIARLPKGGARTQKVRSIAAALKEGAKTSEAAAPLRRAPIAAGVGYLAGKTIGGYAGSGLAMRRNQSDQRSYNLKHPVVKYVENMTVAERRKLSRKKRIAAASSTTTGVLGLGALAARAKKRPDLALNLLTGSAAIGGVNNLNFAGVLRREAKASDPDAKRVTKGALVAKADTKHMAWHSGGSACGMISAPRHRLTSRWSQVTCPGCKKARWLFAKADHREPLTRMHSDTAADLVRRHGDAGPLPSTLSRSERMQAYEARYVHAGGHKGEHWQRRADRADKVKTAGLAGATAGGVGIMTLRHPRVMRALGHRLEHARHAVDTATIGAATASGAGELYAGHARRRRASYSNSKAGVAASALRRMRDYQPQ